MEKIKQGEEGAVRGEEKANPYLSVSFHSRKSTDMLKTKTISKYACRMNSLDITEVNMYYLIG